MVETMSFTFGLLVLALVCIGIIGYCRIFPTRKPKLKETRPMDDNCRVSLFFRAEFWSDNPEEELALLQELAERDPNEFISKMYRRGSNIDIDVNPEELL